MPSVITMSQNKSNNRNQNTRRREGKTGCQEKDSLDSSDGGTLDAGKQLLLFHSVYQGHLDVLKQLLKSGVDPNTRDCDGNPLLNIAIERADDDLAELLLQNERCDVNQQDTNGQTPLMLAVIMEDQDLVKKMIKAGADVNIRDRMGKSALLLALEEGKLQIAEYLIKHGSDVNNVDRLGQSALYLAIKTPDIKCVKTVKKLLNAGYSLDKDKSWMTEEELDADTIRSESRLKKMIKKISGRIEMFAKVQTVSPKTINLSKSV